MISPEPGFEKINRIILVGNGFDLAHGLRSSYNDFLAYYTKEIFSSLIESTSYADPFVNLTFTNLRQAPIAPSFWTPLHLNRLIQQKKIVIKGNSYLFENILSSYNIEKWADIETIYFDTIAKYELRFDIIKKINDQFEHLKNKLIEYLNRQEKQFSRKFNQKLQDQFLQPILPIECKLNSIRMSSEPEHYYFVNFNYTNILKKYTNKFALEKGTLNHIHGVLNETRENNQNPIFGFGDEQDSKLKQYETTRSKEPFVHIKSFKYLESNNYRQLMEFVSLRRFQVQIFGHSCGISDKTMLSTIFEHENCISIKSYYYEKDGNSDFTDRNYAISRLFKDKSELRSKVVNFTLCEPMVQPQ